MKASLIFLIPFLTACFHHHITPDQYSQELMKTDSAFNKLCQDSGSVYAFKKMCGTEIVTMSEGQLPISDKQVYLKSIENGGNVLLSWKPVKAESSSSGDLGYTFGNWYLKSKTKAGTDTTYYGNYISIWKKQPDGSWKYIFDAGVDTPELPMQ